MGTGSSRVKTIVHSLLMDLPNGEKFFQGIGIFPGKGPDATSLEFKHVVFRKP
jgi:hypothetical protein